MSSTFHIILHTLTFTLSQMWIFHTLTFSSMSSTLSHHLSHSHIIFHTLTFIFHISHSLLHSHKCGPSTLSHSVQNKPNTRQHSTWQQWFPCTMLYWHSTLIKHPQQAELLSIHNIEFKIHCSPSATVPALALSQRALRQQPPLITMHICKNFTFKLKCFGRQHSVWHKCSRTVLGWVGVNYGLWINDPHLGTFLRHQPALIAMHICTTSHSTAS